MISEFTNTDRIVMARFTATHKRSAGMIKVAGVEGTHAVANTTILNGRHVVGRFTYRRITMTGVAPLAHNVRAGMIDESANESLGVMA